MKFKIKPLLVDAIEWDGSQQALQQITILGVSDQSRLKYINSTNLLFVGQVSVNLGDWIVRGVDGKLTSVLPALFRLTYDIAE
jgi:hypothetical protein